MSDVVSIHIATRHLSLQIGLLWYECGSLPTIVVISIHHESGDDRKMNIYLLMFLLWRIKGLLTANYL